MLVDTIETNSYGVTAISWSPNVYAPSTIVLGCRDKSVGSLQLWTFAESLNKYVRADDKKAVGLYPVISLAWAPFMGRDYHLIAAATEDTKVSLWRAEMRYDESKKALDPVELVKVQDIECPGRKKKSPRVIAWNLIGGILMVAGKKARRVRLYKADAEGKFRELPSADEK